MGGREKKIGPAVPVIFKEELDQNQHANNSGQPGPRHPLIGKQIKLQYYYFHLENSC